VTDPADARDEDHSDRAEPRNFLRVVTGRRLATTWSTGRADLAVSSINLRMRSSVGAGTMLLVSIKSKVVPLDLLICDASSRIFLIQHLNFAASRFSQLEPENCLAGDHIVSPRPRLKLANGADLPAGQAGHNAVDGFDDFAAASIASRRWFIGVVPA